ncbi:MAG: thermonuclease family protein [Candidatus Bathyarchaeota archaeon]|nr:thermonuclease family protein [Candidatus Bathyarchaeota archaeon]
MAGKTIFFDIEAGGLKADLSSIYSISAQEESLKGIHRQSWYAAPVKETYWSTWTKNMIWDRILKKKREEGLRISTEEQLLRKFTRFLSGQEKGTTLAGWNIGLDMREQTLTNNVRGYDIPFMLRRARKYGLHEELASQLSKFKIRDIGAEYAYKVAGAVSRDELGLVNPELAAGARKYREVGAHLDPRAGARLAAKRFQMAGWKQELMYELFSGRKLEGAHMSDIDIEASSFLEKNRKRFSRERLLSWNRGAMVNKLTASALAPAKPGESGRWTRVLAQAAEEQERVKALLSSSQRWSRGEREVLKSYSTLTADFLSNVRTRAGEKGIAFSDVVAGKVPGEVLEKVGGFTRTSKGVPSAGAAKARAVPKWDLSKALGRKGKIALAVGAGAAALWATEPLGWFSGKDDEYNTLEGMPEGGFSAWLRKRSTDFGSGYQDSSISMALVSGQVADRKVSEEEWRKYVRRTRLAMDEQRSLELLSLKKMKSALNQVNWRGKDPGIKAFGGERPQLGAFGQYNFVKNELTVYNKVDPNEMAWAYRAISGMSASQARGGVGFLYRATDPTGPRETVLHEGLHAIWDEHIDPKDKAAFRAQAEDELGVFFKGPDVKALAAKSPVYAGMIRTASVTGADSAEDWVANELFAHRGAALQYSGLGYQFADRPELDKIVGKYIRKAPKKHIGAAVEDFDPRVAIRQTFAPEDLERYARMAGGTVDDDVSRFYSRQEGLPTELMGQPIDPRILEFRRDVWDVPTKRRELERRTREAQAEAQAKLGQFQRSDFLSYDRGSVAGVNAKREDLARVNLSNFVMNVEDADTILLRRKGMLPWIKSLFGRGQVSVRLAGIDAPETEGHGNDPIGFLRMWQEQPGGQEATAKLQSMIAAQENLNLVVSTGKQTYGRSLGVLVGDQNKNLNLELLRKGAATALPFGPASEDILERQYAARAEEVAWKHREGIWDYARFKAQRVAHRHIGRAITHNTLTNVQKLASNLNLGAYGSWLEGMGSQKREITWSEIEQAQTFGRSLRRSHGPPSPRIKRRSREGASAAREALDGMRYTGAERGHIRKHQMAARTKEAHKRVSLAARDGGHGHRQKAGGFVT